MSAHAKSMVRHAAALERYCAVRQQTADLVAPLSEADCQVQSMPDASPAKWHLGHTTWFFETFVLEPHEPAFKPCHPAFRVLFNSYYNGIGQKHPRPLRGQVTRPGLAEVKAYRTQVDERIAHLLRGPLPAAVLAMIETGIQHEQQHQELILTDIQHALSCNPLQPAYHAGLHLARAAAPASPRPLRWRACEAGLLEIGHLGDGFCFDNESPRHRVWLRPYAMASRLVTQGEWLDFIGDGGYADPRWWLAAGWDWVNAQAIRAPLYWLPDDPDVRNGGWHRFSLQGLVPIEPGAPVVHLSYYEADAYARWRSAAIPADAGARLPTEAEWEAAAATLDGAAVAVGNFVETGALRPMPAGGGEPDADATQGTSGHAGGIEPLDQLFGDAWEWTASSYSAYPGYRPWAGVAGEYNGKFMVNQYVLRGGSCATPRDHIRASYRNFFPTEARWQFSGLRLARDID